MQILILAVVFALWTTFWVAYLGIYIPLRRLTSRPKMSYWEEVCKVTRPVCELIDISRWVAVFFSIIPLIGFANWLGSTVLDLEPTFWLLFWVVTLLPCAVIAPRHRRWTVLIVAAGMVGLEFLNRSTKDAGRFLPLNFFSLAGLCAVLGFLVSMAAAYGLDKWTLFRESSRDS